jgi:prepilin-type N-terminal cleavage/methylation domain-containing protein
MTRAMRRQDGFTLVEMLIVCIISLVIFGATLSAWTSHYRASRSVERQNDNAEAARVALDRAARQLRNLANPTVNAITTIDRATGYDFIFQTSDPSKTWVRYCLQTSGGGTSVDNATLWEHESPNAITAAMRSACPGTGWTRTAAVVEHVTNQAGGIDRDAFTYECAVGSPAGCPSSTAQYSKITNAGIALWVDADRTDRVTELNVATSVFLRNQNEAPTSQIGTPVTRLSKERVLLNGSGSTDPEGRTLEYFWFETAPTAATIASTPCTSPFPGAEWQGVTFNKKFDAGTAGQAKTFYLLVRDPGCLTHMSSVTFSVPT